ncbi:CHAD domain-containing protein [Nodosilinea sp. LEGE 07298]|uniref:CHAD domain-containing protein n=1 Tax=Nodosilinea sp. LEGE 07298 TaxID=2777970 RepID=UPI00188254BC|nr:CHAD domain-containing protein [Nodosilinea sp. LEGE 07298]MBE9111841.1 CHAD domain-containing protein [Nodosilinea sp. LEGE 07298]
MAYKFSADSTVDANIRRILSEQLEKAIQQLSEDFQQTPGQAVHKARKHLKKGRTVLRLVRKSIDKDTYEREKNLLRDLGRSLSSARDSEVYQQTLNNLLDTYGLTLDTKGLSKLQESLSDLYQVRLKDLTDGDTPMAAIISDLKDSRSRLNQLAFNKTGWKAISANLKQIYGQGQARFYAAYEDGGDEAFHDWRKRVKDLWHSTCLLKPLWPTVMNAFESEIHQLAEALGGGHDIAALRHFLLNPPAEVALDNVHLQVLLPLMKHRQHRLHQQAKELGQKLYCEDPAAFNHRMASYWQVWVSSDSSSSAES